jgi:RND family efflux transporter MFP subunit
VQSVYVSPVRNDSGALQRVLFGSLRPRVEADLSFRTAGKVTERLVELGQSVKAGQALARIDPADYQLAVQAATEQQRAAEVDAVQANSDAARFKRLLADGSVGAADAERQQARADAAAARLIQAQRQTELARNRAGYAVLTAPFDGVVTAVRFEAGQLVDDKQVVLSLAKPVELEVVVDVPEPLVAGLKAWQASAIFGNSAEPSQAKPVALRLRELAPSANAATRTTRARYALAAPAQSSDLHMGMSAEVRLHQAGRTSGAELPLGALLVTNTTDNTGKTSTSAPIAGPSVWLVDAKTGALKRRAVQLLSQSIDQVRVAGLEDGALVVSFGAQKLDAGLKVQPVQRPLAALGLGTSPVVTR